MNPVFRELQEDERVFLSEMLYEAIFVEPGKPALPKSIVNDPSLLKYIDDFGVRKGDMCIIVIVHEKPVGACWGRFFSKESPGYGFISDTIPELSIAIHKDYRNQGLGSVLIRELAEYYREQGIKALSLSVDKKNPAYQLYQRMNFVVFSETEKSVVMKLEL